MHQRILCTLHCTGWWCCLPWWYKQLLCSQFWCLQLLQCYQIWCWQLLGLCWGILQRPEPSGWVHPGVVWWPVYLPSGGWTFGGRYLSILLGQWLWQSVPPGHFSPQNVHQQESEQGHIGLSTLSWPVVQSGWFPGALPWTTHYVMRVVPRAYCQPMLCTRAWTLTLVHYSPCCAKLTVPNFLRGLWRGWHWGGHVGQGVGSQLVGR